MTTECNCGTLDPAPFWHGEECPVYATACEDCEGKGYKIVVLSCECCSDTERCEYCDGTGIKSN